MASFPGLVRGTVRNDENLYQCCVYMFVLSDNANGKYANMQREIFRISEADSFLHVAINISFNNIQIL